jgi:hypothetical protein
MRKVLLSLLAVSMLAVLGVTPSMAKQKAQAPKTKVAATQALAQPQTISGTISMVASANRLVIVKDASGTPFDFRVGKFTKIDVNGQKATLKQLSSEINNTVSVRFVPLVSGDLARTIKVS